jgi:glycosyltransferase involved in cell wall biosynthesis
MIVLIGPLPPPVHGEALITERVKDRLLAMHVPLLVCDTAPDAGLRRFRYFYRRAVTYLRCCRTIYRARPDTEPSAIYVALSSGLGLIGEFVVVLIAKLARYEVIFHHHSFSYIVRPSLLLRAVIRVAGRRQLHIALCPTMARQLGAIYGSKLRIEILSNLGIMDLPQAGVGRSIGTCSVIGYLSNISFAKGIDRYLDLLAMMRSKGSRIRGLIAGPFDNTEVQTFVERRIEEIGGINYVGAVHAEQKAAFLSSIDLLVFPSRYKLEAQPLVVFEAQAAGVPVAASERGCIKDLIWTDPMLRLDATASKLEGLANRILEWEKNPQSFRGIVQRGREAFSALTQQSAGQLARFDALMSQYY